MTSPPPALQNGSLSEDHEGLEALLDYLRRTRAFDFGGYKRSTLSRRIVKRIQTVGLGSYADYIDYLEVHPDEFPQLFNTILINVTGFFRDAGTWSGLASHLRRVIDTKPADAPIRAWSAGCASGEEACTLAMVLAELLGMEQYSRRVKIYATDIDEEALAEARLATYGAKQVESVPAEYLERYFTRNGSAFVFHKDLRRAMIFGRHDLVQDAPISRIDVLTCRNTLMYFNAETQTRMLNRLHFALLPNALLLLGKAEMLLTHTELFAPADLKLRLFTRTPSDGKRRERPLSSLPTEQASGADVRESEQLTQIAFQAASVGLITLDLAGRIVEINTRASRQFCLSKHDLGRAFHELELSYRPVELRSCIDRVHAELQPITVKDVERLTADGERNQFDVDVVPLFDDGAKLVGSLLAFRDVTDAHQLQRELRAAHAELESAHEELRSTSEELETTNEELQSTVEELETTNEELQSTNEELETMNEELQSTNEELQTMNHELRQRGEDVNQLNGFLASILASLKAGVAVLDGDMLVKTWNGTMEELWGLRADEANGQHFLNLDIGCPLEDLRQSIRGCLATGSSEERVVDCTNRRGRAIQCKITVTALHGATGRGVLVLFEEVGA